MCSLDTLLLFCTRLEAGSNVILRVVRGDEKGSLKSETVKKWWRVPRDSDPRKTALAKANSIYKRQTHPLVREGSPRNKTVTNIWSWVPDGARHQDLLTDWLIVSRNVTLTLTLLSWTWIHNTASLHWPVFTCGNVVLMCVACLCFVVVPYM
jgi:hypothetical protein